MVDEAEQGEADKVADAERDAKAPAPDPNADGLLPDPFDAADIFAEPADTGDDAEDEQAQGDVAEAAAPAAPTPAFDARTDVFDEAGDGSGVGPTPDGPELDLGVDDLAAGLQSVVREEEEIEELEELDELLEVAEDSTHPRILYLLLDGREHAVNQDRFVIGRVSSQCDLAIIDANISRQHCAIERADGIFFVRDLGSTNGVQVDGVRVDDHPIREGDVLVLSGHRIECSFEPPELAAPPVAAVHLGAGTPSPMALTGRMAALPPLLEEEPEEPLDPDGEIEPGTAVGPPPTAFEARVELRLAALADEVAAMRMLMDRLMVKLDALQGVDALAQLIQRRVQQAKQRK